MNVVELKRRMKSEKITISEMAEKLEIDDATLYRRMKNNGNKITIRDAGIMANVLHLDKDEAHQIFLS